MNYRISIEKGEGFGYVARCSAIPCLTLRNTTERPITIARGTNTLVWNDTHKIVKEALKILDGKGKKGSCPELWDGETAERIIAFITSGVKKAVR